MFNHNCFQSSAVNTHWSDSLQSQFSMIDFVTVLSHKCSNLLFCFGSVLSQQQCCKHSAPHHQCSYAHQTQCLCRVKQRVPSSLTRSNFQGNLVSQWTSCCLSPLPFLSSPLWLSKEDYWLWGVIGGGFALKITPAYAALSACWNAWVNCKSILTQQQLLQQRPLALSPEWRERMSFSTLLAGAFVREHLTNSRAF